MWASGGGVGGRPSGLFLTSRLSSIGSECKHSGTLLRSLLWISSCLRERRDPDGHNSASANYKRLSFSGLFLFCLSIVQISRINN